MGKLNDYAAELTDCAFQGIAEGLADARSYFRAIASAHLAPGETLVSFCQGETKLPFVIRILPFIPDLLTRPKRHLLVLTERRLLILRLTNPFNRLASPVFKKLIASIPLKQLGSIEPRAGVLTSSLTVRTTAGRAYRFVDMLRSTADDFAASVSGLQKSNRAAKAQAAGTSPPPRTPPGPQAAATFRRPTSMRSAAD